MSVVIDASMTMAWCFQDEATDLTATVFRRVQAQGARVPSLWPTEVANSVLVGRRRDRLTAADAARFFESVRGLPVRVETVAPAHVWTSIFELADRQRLTVYDASYLDLAVREHLPLATLDARLKDAAHRMNVPLIDHLGTAAG